MPRWNCYIMKTFAKLPVCAATSDIGLFPGMYLKWILQNRGPDLL